jgi:hypothetical protein
MIKLWHRAYKPLGTNWNDYPVLHHELDSKVSSFSLEVKKDYFGENLA